MRVLITGAAGFAGQHLAALCSQAGDYVTGVGRPASDGGQPSHVDEYAALDLNDAERLNEVTAAAAPERVFHLAADASVSASWDSPGGTLQNNLVSALNVLEAVREHVPEARVLVACSGEEYGPVDPERLPVTETEALRPQNPYAVSKAAVDLLAGFYADAHGLAVLRSRAFNHAGPGQSPAYAVGSFARQIAAAELAGASDSLTITTGNLDTRRDFTDVRDVVRAYRLMLDGAATGVYNVCSGASTRIADVLAGLARHTDLGVEQRTDPALLRVHEVMEIRGSHDKLSLATGWTPEIPLDRTLADALDHWRGALRTESR